MARPGSRAIAGYFPIPVNLLPSIASCVDLSRPSTNSGYGGADVGRLTLLDPCAGTGEAVGALAKTWGRTLVVAAELERERASRLREQRFARAFHADAFSLHWNENQEYAHVLFLNPPYDTDPDFGRLEERFLQYFTSALESSNGVLLYVVPARALKASAQTLSTHYVDHRIWRFPEPEYSSYQQVLVVARRISIELNAPRVRAEIEGWADDPSALPVLEESCRDPLEVDLLYTSSKPMILPKVLKIPSIMARRELADWSPVPDCHQSTLDELEAPTFSTAGPPRPAHIALALSEGAFDGVRLDPNDLTRYPPVLAKGTYTTRFVKVESTPSEDGKSIKVRRVEVPTLAIRVLDLESYEYHALVPGGETTGSTDPSEWTTADFFELYSGALVQHFEKRFPILHDRRRADHALEVPTLLRKPFEFQTPAVLSALKVLAKSDALPIFQADVGTGKTTLALLTALALMPSNWQCTTSALQTQGFPAAKELPQVRRVLVMCPPHLIESWRDEIAAFAGDEFDVFVLDDLSSVDRAFANPGPSVLLLSRESAKLGGRWSGIRTGKCPGCGQPIRKSSSKLASHRVTCSETLRRPLGSAARMFLDMSTVLAPYLPYNGLITTLLPASTRARLLHREVSENGSSAPGPRVTRALEGLLIGFVAEHPEPDDSLQGHLRNARWSSPGAEEWRTAWGEILRVVASEARWEERECGTQLYEMTTRPLAQGECQLSAPRANARKGPRRYALSKYIHRRYRGRYQMLILDEAHELTSLTSAQSQAAQRLSGPNGVKAIPLTGSLVNGYASSLFLILWLTSPDFRSRYSKEDMGRFLAAYGFREEIEIVSTIEARGTTSDRKLNGVRYREHPGVKPGALLRFLLPQSVIIHASDLESSLPAKAEESHPLCFDTANPTDVELECEHGRLLAELLAAIRSDMARTGMSKLVSQLVHLPTFLDRCTDDLAPYEIRRPESEGRELVAAASMLPASYRTPKERHLLDTLYGNLGRDRRTLVFLQNTGDGLLPQRLLRIIESDIGEEAVWLDARKVPTKKRQRWIETEFVDSDRRVLLVHPKAVSTGLNCLRSCCETYWHQLGYDPRTYVQANGRVFRIGQTQDVRMVVPYLAGTPQEIAFHLMSSKLDTLAQVDGRDLRAGLAALGAVEAIDHTTASLSFANALHAALSGKLKIDESSSTFSRIEASRPLPPIELPSQKPPGSAQRAADSRVATRVSSDVGSQRAVPPIAPTHRGAQLQLFS